MTCKLHVLLRKGWPFGSRLWCLIAKLSLYHWYPGSGVVLDCIDSWSLPSVLLLFSLLVKIFYWLFQGGASFVDHLFYLCFVFVMLSCPSIAAFWSPAVTGAKGLPHGSLVCDVFLSSFLSLPHVVSLVRCDTWLYRFLSFVLLLILIVFMTHLAKHNLGSTMRNPIIGLCISKRLGPHEEMSRDMWFPTMWHFDKCWLRRACTASFWNWETPNDVRSVA